MKEGQYRVSDLARCQVVTESGEVLGRLADVYPTRANDVFVVRGAREYLIPALKSVVMEINLEACRIVVRMPAGLKEIYEAL